MRLRVLSLALALLALLLAALTSAGSAFAQASAPSAAPLDKADTAFLKHAAEAGLAEVEAARLAIDKGVNTQVKGFAQQMSDDHTRMHAELRTLATAKGVRLPIEPSLGQRTKIKLLSAADGGSFDRKYANALGVKAHEDALRLFQKAANNATDPQVKDFALKAVPQLQHHLEMARELKGVVEKEGNVKAPGDKKQ
jgi:putative membrane protein